MNPWSFVLAAYAVGVSLTTALLLWAFVAMKKAEQAAQALRHK